MEQQIVTALHRLKVPWQVLLGATNLFYLGGLDVINFCQYALESSVQHGRPSVDAGIRCNREQHVLARRMSVSQNQSTRRKQAGGEIRCNPVQYTPEPWRILEQTPGDAWVVVGESSAHGARTLATIPDAASDGEQQANARLIAQAASMHRAAVKLLCAWGTEDAPEAMEELAVILSQAVRS
ncbi:MAG TPA: hypothetical protein VFC29_14290 [Candidatus Limnocylindrales bacterium]|nr:hypothetical protein [Candidatus Limnocylindrales bacterium]